MMIQNYHSQRKLSQLDAFGANWTEKRVMNEGLTSAGQYTKRITWKWPPNTPGSWRKKKLIWILIKELHYRGTVVIDGTAVQPVPALLSSWGSVHVVTPDCTRRNKLYCHRSGVKFVYEFFILNSKLSGGWVLQDCILIGHQIFKWQPMTRSSLLVVCLTVSLSLMLKRAVEISNLKYTDGQWVHRVTVVLSL